MNARLSALHAAGCLRRVDVALGDWFARAFSDAAPEAALAAALASRAVADGHSALALDGAQAWLAGLADGHAAGLPEPAAWQRTLAASAGVQSGAGAAAAAGVPLVIDPQRRVYLRRYFEYERQLAHTLRGRAMATPADAPFPIPAALRAGSDPEQQRAIAAALAHRFTLVTGGPGTGKTHGVVRMLAALAVRAHARAEPLRIALAAPTGKAAARLRESVRTQLARLALPDAIAELVPRDAGTLHRLLGLSPWQTRPRHDRPAPLPFEVVVVDEASMVDLALMAKLVDAVPATARLILLGDPDQLAAVEAGNVLGALVEAAAEPPLRECHVALTRSHRFAADSPLGALAGAIARGDAESALATCGRGDDTVLTETMDGARFIAEAASAYRGVTDAASAEAALHAAAGFRVLTARRRGPWGCVALDRAIVRRLQHHAGVREDERWWRGRLLLATANRPELGLHNGDIGVVWPGADGSMRAWFEGADGTLRPFAPAALPPHEGAFALTVHKAQGSEFDRVALVVGPDSAVLTRELLYTGVTRARARVTLYAAATTLRAGIARRTLRMTGLADRLREAGGVPGDDD